MIFREPVTSSATAHVDKGSFHKRGLFQYTMISFHKKGLFLYTMISFHKKGLFQYTIRNRARRQVQKNPFLRNEPFFMNRALMMPVLSEKSPVSSFHHLCRAESIIFAEPSPVSSFHYLCRVLYHRSIIFAEPT